MRRLVFAIVGSIALAPSVPAQTIEEKAQICGACHGKNDIMTPLAQTLERDDMMALALHFSQKPWPDLQQPPAPPDVAKRALAANVSIGCTGCHQGEYQGAG